MRIDRIETIKLECHWGPPEDNKKRVWPVNFVHTDSGLTGISRGGDPRLVEEEFAPLLVGEDPRRTGSLWQKMYETAWRFRGPGLSAMTTIGALDVALWDLYGKSCNEPVWRLLGGYRNRVQAYADGIGYVHQNAEEVAGLVRKHADLGYKAIKFHLSDADEDLAVEKVRLSRAALGEDLDLLIDVHRMWDGTRAAGMARRFAPYNLYWIEEPVRGDDEAAHMKMVREATDALVAGGESEGTLYGIRHLIQAGGLQVVQSDILGGGGFTGLMRMAALAEAHHVYIAPHGASYPEINSHFVAAVPNGLLVSACPHTEPYQIWSELYAPAFEIENGEIELSERPGLGLEFDPSYIDSHRV
jgi:D-galactarolactone cycloisomerase